VGSGHCDPEDPSDSLCPLACGRGDRSTTPIFRRYAIAFLGCVLQADPSYAPYIGGAELDADQTANRLDQVDQAELLTLPCQGAAPPFDAGISVDTGVVPSDDTGTGPADQGLLGDTGASPDAGIRPDAASPSPSPTDDAEGCTSLGGAALPTTLLLLGLSAFRRRRTPPQ
jgi:hypothetical protein